MNGIVMPKSESLDPVGRGGGELWGTVAANTVINKDSIPLVSILVNLPAYLRRSEYSLSIYNTYRVDAYM